MRVAIIHDWIMSMRGGEKCLEVFCELFPDATLFTLVHKKGIASKTIESMNIKTSFIQKMPKVMSMYRSYLPFFSKAIESFDLSGYDFILSSSHCVAKGVRVPDKAKHICYCYTPMRYIWFFFNEYFASENIIKRKFIAGVTTRLKEWDLKRNKNVDYFIAISDNVRHRISNIYNRQSDVIYPPVDVDNFFVSYKDKGYYLIVSALVPYKRIDLAINAFNKIGKRLIIVGSGNVENRLKKIAHKNIEFIGNADDSLIKEFYAGCKALIFPGEEDFGIVPVEAQACGKPVIAYAKGGALETIRPLNELQVIPRLCSGQASNKSQEDATGVFFYEQTPEALIDAVDFFEKNTDKFIPDKIRQNSLRFSRDIFKQKIKNYIDEKLKKEI